MSTRQLIMPEISRMIKEAIHTRDQQPANSPQFFHYGGQITAFNQVKKLLLGIGVKVQSTTYPEPEESMV